MQEMDTEPLKKHLYNWKVDLLWGTGRLKCFIPSYPSGKYVIIPKAISLREISEHKELWV
jgi:hypothetical protein